jgi:hypothetical protein
MPTMLASIGSGEAKKTKEFCEPLEIAKGLAWKDPRPRDRGPLEIAVPQIVPPTGPYCVPPRATSVADHISINRGKYKQ